MHFTGTQFILIFIKIGQLAQKLTETHMQTQHVDHISLLPFHKQG
jgi:hypothetical protein